MDVFRVVAAAAAAAGSSSSYHSSASSAPPPSPPPPPTGCFSNSFDILSFCAMVCFDCHIRRWFTMYDSESCSDIQITINKQETK